jgi:hypothetical protein
MSYTKRQFVTAAFEEIGLASSAFQLESEDLQFALRRLDALIAEWNGRGIKIGYPMPTSPELSDLDTETNVPDSANEAIICALAIRIGPSFGKVISRETKTTAIRGYNTLLSRAAMPPEMNFTSRLPYGAGNKPRQNGGRQFFPNTNNSDKSDAFENLEFID